MKTVLIFLLSIFVFFNLHARTPDSLKCYKKGIIVIEGLIGAYHWDRNIGNETIFPTLYTSLEWAPFKWLGIAPSFYYQHTYFNQGNFLGYENISIPSIRFNYHFLRRRKFDAYAGLSYGIKYYNESVPHDNYEYNYHSAFEDIHVGAKYYVAHKIAITAEINGRSFLLLGLAYRFSKK